MCRYAWLEVVVHTSVGARALFSSREKNPGVCGVAVPKNTGMNQRRGEGRRENRTERGDGERGRRENESGPGPRERWNREKGG